MEPIVPMTFASPQFVLSVLMILAAVAGVYIVARTIERIGATELGAKFINPQFVITLALMAIILFVIWLAYYGPIPVSGDIQIAIVTAVIINGLPELRKFWLNSTADSEAKNSTIAQQARTAAAQTDALLDPNVVVTNTGDGKPRSRAVLDDAAPTPAAPTGNTIQAQTVNVAAVDAHVGEIDPAKGKAP